VFLCVLFLSVLGADVSAHGAFLFCSVQCHLLSIFCTFVIEKVNDNNDDDDDILRSARTASYYILFAYATSAEMFILSRFQKLHLTHLLLEMPQRSPSWLLTVA